MFLFGFFFFFFLGLFVCFCSGLVFIYFKIICVVFMISFCLHYIFSCSFFSLVLWVCLILLWVFIFFIFFIFFGGGLFVVLLFWFGCFIYF